MVNLSSINLVRACMSYRVPSILSLDGYPRTYLVLNLENGG